MSDAPDREVPVSVDAAVLGRLRGGEAGAFETVLRAYYDTVFRFAARMLGDQDAACDVAQEAFVRLHAERRRINPAQGVLSWLFAVAHNLCLTHLRRRAVEARAVAQLNSPAAVPDPADRAVLAESVRQALAALTPDQRAVVILREYHGLRHDEIARIVGCSPGAARVKAHRARQRLRELLADVID